MRPVMFVGSTSTSAPAGVTGVFAGALIGGLLSLVLPENHKILRIATGAAVGASIAGLVVALAKTP